VHLIDRDVGLTFKRASQRLGWWGRAKLGGGLVASLFADEDVGHEEIEKLKQGDLLESSFGEFADDSPELYDTVIAERDRYMAARLRESADRQSGARKCSPSSAQDTCRGSRSTCAKRRAIPPWSAPNSKRARRSRPSRGSPSSSRCSCSADSCGGSGAAVSMSAPT
jgi:hypothetical protein